MNMLRPEALKHLHPGWFSIVMGLAGLSLAWAQNYEIGRASCRERV